MHAYIMNDTLFNVFGIKNMKLIFLKCDTTCDQASFEMFMFTEK